MRLLHPHTRGPLDGLPGVISFALGPDFLRSGGSRPDPDSNSIRGTVRKAAISQYPRRRCRREGA